MQIVRRIYQQALDRGYGQAPLPFAMAKKHPNAERDWVWQFVFPAINLKKDDSAPFAYRHPLHETGVQKALKAATRLAGIPK